MATEWVAATGWVASAQATQLVAARACTQVLLLDQECTRVELGAPREAGEAVVLA